MKVKYANDALFQGVDASIKTWKYCDAVPQYTKTFVIPTQLDPSGICGGELGGSLSSCCTQNLFSIAIPTNDFLKKSYKTWKDKNNAFKSTQTAFMTYVNIKENVSKLRYLADRIKFIYKDSSLLGGLSEYSAYYANNVDYFLNSYFNSSDFNSMKSEFDSDYSSSTTERYKCYSSIWNFRRTAVCKMCMADNSKFTSDQSLLRVKSNVCLKIVTDCAKTWRHMIQVQQANKLFWTFIQELQDPVSNPPPPPPPTIDEDVRWFDLVSHKFINILSGIVNVTAVGSTIKFDEDIQTICQLFLRYDYKSEDEEYIEGKNPSSWDTALSNKNGADISLGSFKKKKLADLTVGQNFSPDLSEKITLAKAELEDATTSVGTIATQVETFKKQLDKDKLNTISATSNDDKLLTMKPMLRTARNYQKQIAFGKQTKIALENKIDFIRSQLSEANKLEFDKEIASTLTTFQTLIKTNFEDGITAFDADVFSRDEFLKDIESKDALIFASVEKLKVAFADLKAYYNSDVLTISSGSYPTDKQITDLKKKANAYLDLFTKARLITKIINRGNYIEEWKFQHSSAVNSDLNTKLVALTTTLRTTLTNAFVTDGTGRLFVSPTMKDKIDKYSDYMSKEGKKLYECNVDSTKITPTITQYVEKVTLFAFKPPANGQIEINDEFGIELSTSTLPALE